jgi:hypothetical protein
VSSVFGRGIGKQKDDTATVGWKGFLPSSPTRALRRHHMRASPQSVPQGSGGPGKRKCHRDQGSLAAGNWERSKAAKPSQRLRRTPVVDVTGFLLLLELLRGRGDAACCRNWPPRRAHPASVASKSLACVGHNHLELCC